MQTSGEILRAERQKKGLSIKDVEQATSIRSLYLNAIEEGNYSIVPGEVYLKGFIRNYATFLGLNGPEIVELYRQEKNTPPPAPEVSTTATVAQSVPPAATTSQKLKENRNNSSSFKWLAIILIPAAAAAGFWWYSQSPQPTPNQPNVKITPSAPAQPVQPNPPVVQAPVTPTTPTTPVAPAQAKPVMVVAKYTDECWTLVMADGKEVYEGIPKIGETLSWNAQQNITLRLGNASAADITYNGKPQGKLGEKGEVIVRTFTPNQ